MNDYIGKGQRFKYNADKKKFAAMICAHIRLARLRPVARAHFTWQWRERNKRRDPDNFIGIIKKFTLDALQLAGILTGDGWDQVAGFTDTWEVSSEPGVVVIIEEVIHGGTIVA